jgi:hypothetical protein
MSAISLSSIATLLVAIAVGKVDVTLSDGLVTTLSIADRPAYTLTISDESIGTWRVGDGTN